MEKISLIAWRRRERKFPETEAQRRARAREEYHGEAQPDDDLDALEALATASILELSGVDEELFIDAVANNGFLFPAQFQDGGAQAPKPLTPSCVDIDLTPEQSENLHSLPLLSDASPLGATPMLFEVNRAPAQGRVTLQFSLRLQAVPEMISLKDLCRQLKVGRRAVMRLVRQGDLRCYRIANRYRFAVDDVKHYLERIAH